MSPAVSSRPARPAIRVRWCTAQAPPPRPAYNSAAEAYPGLGRRAWWRLVCLMAWRGLVDRKADGCLLRMARHLARVADEHGRVSDLPAVMRFYAARHHLSVQTGWTDLGRLIERGLVRQLQAAAPGYPARYHLSAPATVIASLPGLPADLARAIGQRARSRGPGGENGWGAPAALSRSCTQLDTSPTPCRGSPPSPGSTRPDETHRSPRRRPEGISADEGRRALSVLSACLRNWQAQRGPGRLPGAGQLAEVTAMTALVLRYLPPGEVTELLTDRVASAENLLGVLAWRLGRVLAAARRRDSVPADEHGHGYAAMLAARARRVGPPAAWHEHRAALDKPGTRQAHRNKPPGLPATSLGNSATVATRATRTRAPPSAGPGPAELAAPAKAGARSAGAPAPADGPALARRLLSVRDPAEREAIITAYHRARE